MCSLDLNRKQHTRTVLKQIFTEAEQLVVMAHDPYFIRDLWDALTPRDGSAPVSIFNFSMRRLVILISPRSMSKRNANHRTIAITVFS